MLIEEEYEENLFVKVLRKIQINIRKKIDQYILYKKSRWFVNILLALLFCIRIASIDGFYVVTYIYFIYQLQLIIEYFTPLGLPSVNEQDENDDDFQDDFDLPTTLTNKFDDKEYRPLLRTTTEYKAWQNSLVSVLIAYLCTLLKITDIPVYWPFLFSYFFFIVGITIKKYWKHMQKYGYSLQDFNRK